MKVTIKNSEYKLYHNLEKGTVVSYNGEGCVIAEDNLIVGIYSGNVYKVKPTQKIITSINKKEERLKELPVGEFFILDNKLYLLINRDSRFICYSFNDERVKILTSFKDTFVQIVDKDNIQIKVK